MRPKQDSALWVFAQSRSARRIVPRGLQEGQPPIQMSLLVALVPAAGPVRSQYGPYLTGARLRWAAPAKSGVKIKPQHVQARSQCPHLPHEPGPAQPPVSRDVSFGSPVFDERFGCLLGQHGALQPQSGIVRRGRDEVAAGDAAMPGAAGPRWVSNEKGGQISRAHKPPQPARRCCSRKPGATTAQLYSLLREL